MVRLSSDQKRALKKLLSWHESGWEQYVTLGGYAGTGKTTLIAVLRKAFNKQNKKLKVAFCSYTGKAARVLRENLKNHSGLFSKDTVGTIHSLIYSPVENDRQEIVGWERKDSVSADLIIVDEASMIDKEIWEDLTWYNIPIIAVGDHGQLPPIKGSFSLMTDPNIRLEEIHRQAKDNPIIKLSIIARERGAIPIGEYSPKVKKFSRTNPEAGAEVEELLAGYDQDSLILCGYNNTRVRLNTFIRSQLGFEDPEPEPGDRVICLRNNHEHNIYNGMLGTISKISREDEDWYFAEIQMDAEEDEFSGSISVRQFNQKEPLNFTEHRRTIMNGDLFDFGYAITVHKAQGSESKQVILFEERFKQMTDEEWSRWLYTGVTRAQEELYLIGE